MSFLRIDYVAICPKNGFLTIDYLLKKGPRRTLKRDVSLKQGFVLPHGSVWLISPKEHIL